MNNLVQFLTGDFIELRDYFTSNKIVVTALIMTADYTDKLVTTTIPPVWLMSMYLKREITNANHPLGL